MHWTKKLVWWICLTWPLYLSCCISELSEKYEDCLIYIRGDGNVNNNNKERLKIFNTFLSSHRLIKVPINHKTYHHFLGGGSFDSEIDIILQSQDSPYTETISNIYCSNDDPTIDSHHDVIISAFSLPYSEPEDEEQDLLEAPRIDHTRHKILWTDEGILKYQLTIAERLSELRMRWSIPSSKTSLSILLSSTNDILNKAAISTNKSVNLNVHKPIKSSKTPKEIRDSEFVLKKLARKLKATGSDDSIAERDIKQALAIKKGEHRKLVRKCKQKQDMYQNEKLFTLISNSPGSAFNFIKSARPSSTLQVPYISVSDKKYAGSRVIDGLYESILRLKTVQPEVLEASPLHAELLVDYKHIKDLCANKVDLPPIPMSVSSDILYRIKPAVSDFFSITASHFVNAWTDPF